SANVEALRLTWGGTQLDAEGTFGETADLRWRVNVPDLSSLLEDAGGNLSGTGAITGTLPLPRVRAELEGAALAYAEYALERLAIDADVDLTGEASSSLAVDAEHGVLADLALERLSVRGSGTPGGHRLSAELRSSRG